jgi:ribosomal protein L30E
MPEAAQLAKILKDSMKGGKYILGAKEVVSGMKGSRVILSTKSLPPRLEARVRSEAQRLEVPIVDLKATSSELARMIGRPFRVSVIALRTLGENDLKQLQK